MKRVDITGPRLAYWNEQHVGFNRPTATLAGRSTELSSSNRISEGRTTYTAPRATKLHFTIPTAILPDRAGQ
jgi:hypothetical protein